MGVFYTLRLRLQSVDKKYNQKTIKGRLEAFFLDNLNKIVTSDQLREVAKDPTTGAEPENWSQRISDLRCVDGYTILSVRDPGLKLGQYMMPNAEKRQNKGERLYPTKEVWEIILKRAGYGCEWIEDGIRCNLKNGEIDPIGGGTVKLTADHATPHSINAHADPTDPTKWRALCSRHQVTKKNYWDSETGKINYIGLMQAAKIDDKKGIYEFLKKYFEKP